MLAPYTDITPHLPPTQGLRYATGLMVYDEAPVGWAPAGPLLVSLRPGNMGGESGD